MNKKILLILYVLFIKTFLYGQTAIDVTEQTIKIGATKEEVMYFGFAEGDQIVFNFTELKGKELKEIEIIEYPTSSKFMDFKVEKIENKIINVSSTGIYKFRFSNSAITGRVCKIKIQRIPSGESTVKFNSSVYWKTIHDTVFVGKKEKYLISKDTTITNLTDQISKVHSQTNLNGNKTTMNFVLPPNTVSWSYYIGVDQSGKEAFDKAVTQMTKAALPILKRIPGYGPMAALALGGTSFLSKIQAGEDIDYYIVDNSNVNLFLNGNPFSYYKTGKVLNDYSQMLSPKVGMMHVCLYNDNAVTGVNVTVKVTAVSVKEEWGTREVQTPKVSSYEEPYLKN